MRHRARSRKLSRTSAHRSALYRNLVTSLLLHERIETTDAKAKEVRRVADRMITLGKRGTLHARRRAARVIRSRDVAGKVFGELAERFRERPGGYTRVLKVRHRVGDAAPLSIVELVEEAAPAKSAGGKKASGKKASARKAASAGDAEADEKPARKKATRKKASASSAAAGEGAAARKTARKKKSQASRPAK